MSRERPETKRGPPHFEKGAEGKGGREERWNVQTILFKGRQEKGECIAGIPARDTLIHFAPASSPLLSVQRRQQP